ncbi:hypothetical protein [Cryobacterium tagatosivorans]|uniref:Uncharacterized protein n=1 Tax=Cryobacterium tagatosivorans TaxID=1259199 RepID=A0A4R8UBP8_9MICO|nr:hypothetical protein [Cryobacterium tagatosivorans]TFB47269.1 hypothetical protein E3O23_15545 [Cryobacterium tagatosivorans]
MHETRIAVDLRLDISVPGFVGYETHQLPVATLVLAVIVDTEIDPRPHLRLLLTAYQVGWNLAAQHVANPGGTRHAERVVAPIGLPELIRAAYTDAFYVGYGDRQQFADSESQAAGPWDPFVFTATEQDAVDAVVRYLR